MVIDCGLRPAGVENDRALLLSCIAGGATLIVSATLAGLPLMVFPVLGSMALTVIVVAYVDPPGSPVAFTMIVAESLFPPTSCCLGPAESETKLGAPAARDAVQLSDPPPVLLIVNG